MQEEGEGAQTALKKKEQMKTIKGGKKEALTNGKGEAKQLKKYSENTRQ